MERPTWLQFSFLKYGCPICTQRNAMQAQICLNLWGRLTFSSFLPCPQRKKQQSREEIYCVGATSKSLSIATTTSGTNPRTVFAHVTTEWHPRWSTFLWGILGLPSGFMSLVSLRLLGHIGLCCDWTSKTWAYSTFGCSAENLLNNGYLWLLHTISNLLLIQ